MTKKKKSRPQSPARRRKPQQQTEMVREPQTLRMAKTLWSRGRYEQSLKKFNEAVRENRWNVQVLVDAARAFSARYQFDKSDSLLQRALKVGGKRYDVQFLVGQSYRMAGSFEDAEHCFRRACQLAESSPQAQLELASLHERRHRLDEALDTVNQALRTKPQWAAGQVMRARIHRRRGAADLAEHDLRVVTELSAVQPKLLAEAWGELALLKDQLGDFEAAWDAILECKRILLPHSHAEQKAAAHVNGRFRRLAEAINDSDFARWREPTEDAITGPLALLTGFPRSGTTLLEQVLDSHPRIISAEEQEIMSAEVFADMASRFSADTPVQEVLDSLSREQIESLRKRYFDLVEAVLRRPLESRWLLDKNPAMTPMIPVVLRLLPAAKLLVALRDPRDVVLSCFLRYLPLNPVSVNFLSLEKTVQRYQLDMRAWLKFRPLLLPTQWLEIRYEDAVKSLRSEAQRALGFLNLDWHKSVDRYRDHIADKHVLSPTYETVGQPVYATSVGRWRNYARQLEPIMNELQPLISELDYDNE